MAWYDLQSDFHRENDNWWKKILKGLNNALNPGHAWFDYDKMAEGNVIDKLGDSVGELLDHVANPNVMTSLVDKYSGAHLTGAEQEANEFSAQEAQKSRDFTEYMARNKYSMETQSMMDAGINPAMVYGGGSLVSTASNGAAPSSVSPQSGDIGNLIMSLVRMPYEINQIKANIDKTNADTKYTEQKTETEIQITRINTINADYQDVFNAQTLDNMKAVYDNTIADSNLKSANRDYVRTQKDAQSITNKYLDERNREEINQIKANISKMSADEAKVRSEKVYQDWYNGFVQVNGFLPSSNDVLLIGTYIASLFGIAKNDVESWLNNAIEDVTNFITGKGTPRDNGKGGSTSSNVVDGPKGNSR